MSKRKLLKEVLSEFKKVHGEKYDYSLINSYNNSDEKLPIICHEKDEFGNEHGVFFQSRSKHFSRKHGCPKCAKSGVKYTPQEFKEKIKKIYGDKYSTEKTIYVNSHTISKFICKEHGEFETKPYYLLQGHGCPLCGRKIVSEKLSLTNFEVIKMFIDKHGNKYDYSKVEYISNNIKVCIICPKHGEFWQTPHSHLSGNGCHKCKRSHLETEVSVFLDNNNIKYEEQHIFVWEKNKKFDFYLPEYSIAIECQGIQHYLPSNFGNKNKTPEEMYEYVCHNDIIKYNGCKNNGIKLIYFCHDNLILKNNHYTNENCAFSIEELKKKIYERF